MLEKHGLPLFVRQENIPPCQGCPSSCCSPVKTTLSESFPLSIDDRRQTGKNSQQIEEVRKGIIEYIKEIVMLRKLKSIDGRFHLRGFYILEDPEKPIDEFTTSEGELLMAWNITVCVLYDCAAYDEPQGICTRYETRPPMCIKYSSDHCGMDSLSRMIYTKDTYDGKRRDATIELHDKVNREAKPSVEEAFEDFLIKMGEVPLFV